MTTSKLPCDPRRALIALALLLSVASAGCSTPQTTGAAPEQRFAQPLETQTDALGVALIGVLAAGHPQTLIRDAGWREYLLQVENRGDAAVVIETVKLLNGEGRYLDSAMEYAEIKAPPDPSDQVVAGVAKSTAGVVAGQIVPFGGYFVSVVSTAASAAGASATGNDRQDFAIRRLKAVELAPGGRVSGSAFLPNILDPRALVLDYSVGEQQGRARIELPRSRAATGG